MDGGGFHLAVCKREAMRQRVCEAQSIVGLGNAALYVISQSRTHTHRQAHTHTQTRRPGTHTIIPIFSIKEIDAAHSVTSVTD